MRGRTLFIAGGACLALALSVWLIPVGYGATALCLAGLGACFLFFGLVRRRRAKRLGAAGAAVLGIGLCLFLAAEIPVLRDARSDADTSADYLIVFGAGINGEEPSVSLADRLESALVWLEENPSGVAVVSGCQGADEVTSEARVMYRWLTERGVAPERVLLEERAENSYENIVYSLKIIARNGGEPAGRVALLSSEYHLHRLRYMAERLGCDPVCVAAPTRYATLRVNYCIREAFAMWKCWVFGME